MQLTNSTTRVNLEKSAILLLDGDWMSLNILTQILSGFGARNIQKFTAADAAQRATETSAFDLIVVDPSTLGSEGYEFVKWLRRQGSRANRHTSILIITGQTQVPRVAAARDAGANFVVAKPMTPAVILDRIIWMARDKRPHVECKVYAGPDRRFKVDGPPTGLDGRREGDLQADVEETSEPHSAQGGGAQTGAMAS
jgi:DNA-binding response OmpR family regulator